MEGIGGIGDVADAHTWSLLRPRSREDISRMEHSIMSERAPVARVGASNINRQLDSSPRSFAATVSSMGPLP